MRVEKLEELLDWHDGTEDFERRMLDNLSNYDEIIIFGAGIGGRQTYELLKSKGLAEKIRAFSDNHQEKIGFYYMGCPVIAPDEIIQKYSLALILVSSTAFNIILEQLIEMGIDRRNIYYFQPAGISLEQKHDMSFIRQNIQKFEFIYQLLQDEESRLIFRCLLNYRITKSTKWLDRLNGVIQNEDKQYFDRRILDEYVFEDGFVDAGAYTGDTLDSFYKHFPQWKGNYYCLEASDEIYRQLNKKIKQMPLRKIYAYKYAVWSEIGKLRFDSNSCGKGSRISDEGELVNCAPLDELLSDRNIDFIKMDIEGAEKRALMGARQLICRNHPILAVCIYHKPEDFFEIPMVIEDISGDEYEYYIRQYRYGLSETVLYAVPRKRKK